MVKYYIENTKCNILPHLYIDAPTVIYLSVGCQCLSEYMTFYFKNKILLPSIHAFETTLSGGMLLYCCWLFPHYEVLSGKHSIH